MHLFASPPPPSLAEVVAAEGEEGLLELLSVSFDPDTATCQVAMALQLESGFPLVDDLQLQISNAQTGEVVSNALIAVVIITALEDDGADEGDSGGPLINAVTAIEYGLIAANVPIPDVGEGETLSFSLVFSDFETTLVVEIPGLTFPGCLVAGSTSHVTWTPRLLCLRRHVGCSPSYRHPSLQRWRPGP